jgi:hypothetical protein
MRVTAEQEQHLAGSVDRYDARGAAKGRGHGDLPIRW